MPRGPRLDAPGVLHHVVVRGLERRVLFRDDRDRADFLGRVAALAASGAWTVSAWAPLPNHGHLLLRTGARPLAGAMRALLSGYAGAFNRRHTATATSSRTATSPSWWRRKSTAWSSPGAST
jgi:putative transposase